MEEPVLSVVIPTYRRPGCVERSVRAWLAQTVAVPLEVVVVDDGSGDDTTARLARVAAHDPRLRVHAQANRGRAAARNAALAHARGRFVAFADDDVRPRDELVLGRWLERTERAGGAWVARLRVPDAVVHTPVQRAWRTHLEGGTERFADGAHLGQGGFWFAALLVAREALAGERFDERFGGYGWEDLELGYRLHRRGLRARIMREVEVWHDDAVTLTGLERKHEAFGRSGWAFVRRHGRLSVRVWTGTWWPVRVGKALLRLEARGRAAHERIAALADDPEASAAPSFSRDLKLVLEAAYARGVRLGAR